MEKNKKRVFTGTVAMLVILFGLLRIAIFTGYHMVTPFLPEIARNLDTTIVVIGLAISIRSAMGFLGPVWGGIIDLFGKKNSLLIALLTFAASYAAIYFFPSFPCFVVALPISYAATLTFDSAMYSYLSEMIPYEGRGRMTAVLEAAYALGFMIGSPVAGVLMENFGWAVPFVLMAGFCNRFRLYSPEGRRKTVRYRRNRFSRDAREQGGKRLIFPQTFARTQG
jgi:MFS family permease